MTQIKVISDIIEKVRHYQNDLRPRLLDLNKLIQILDKLKRVDSNPERELSVDEIFEVGSFLLVECRNNKINFYEPVPLLKPIIDSIGIDVLAFVDFLYCSRNLDFSFFSVFSKLNPTIRRELPKILNTLLYYECCSLTENTLNLLLNNIGREGALSALESLMKDRCTIPKSCLQEIIFATLAASHPTCYANIVLLCAKNNIELTPVRLKTLKTQEQYLAQIYAVAKMLNANGNDIDVILSHPNLPVLAQIMHRLCGTRYAESLLMFSNTTLHLPKETLLKFLHIESIGSWWNALRLLSRHQLLIAPAIDELLNHPARVNELSRMSNEDCEKQAVENCLYAGKDLGSEQHLSPWPAS